MSTWALIRGTAWRIVFSPSCCLLLALAAVLPMVLPTLNSQYLHFNYRVSGRYIGGGGFLGAALGVSMAVSRLASIPWTLSAITRRERLVVEIAVLWFVVLLFEALAVAPLIAADGTWPSGLARGLLLTNLHWAALALVVLRLPVRPRWTAMVTLASGWWLPAALTPSSRILQGLHRCVDVGPYLEPNSASVETLLGALVDMTPAGVLLVATILLARPDTASNEIRNPR